MCQNIPNNFQLGFAKVRWLEKTKKTPCPSGDLIDLMAKKTQWDRIRNKIIN